MRQSLRPPTKRMIKKLKECLENETLSYGRVPCLPEDMKSSLSGPGLYKRGFISTKFESVNNKNILCIYVTDLGKMFLSFYDEENSKIQKK